MRDTGGARGRTPSYSRILSAEEVEDDEHRAAVGGLWAEIGRLQFEFMVREGELSPEMKLLDVGCGCLRGGVHFIPYLDPGNYFGIDSNPSLIDAGYSVEVPRHGLAGRIDRDQLLVTDDFGAWRFGVSFDRAIAVSVWTHLPLNQIQRSIRETARVLSPGGSMYASLFLCQTEDQLFGPITHQPGGVTSHRDRDPYHYLWDDIRHACKAIGLRPELIGDWEHPRAQQMVKITVPEAGTEHVTSSRPT